VPIEHLNHRFLFFAQVPFSEGQKESNPVAGCVETMKHRFIDFTQDVFCGDQKAENEVLGLFDFSLPRPRPSRTF
jgi:hypothetical protein